jgi:hypothetical protein
MMIKMTVLKMTVAATVLGLVAACTASLKPEDKALLDSAIAASKDAQAAAKRAEAAADRAEADAAKAQDAADKAVAAAMKKMKK